MGTQEPSERQRQEVRTEEGVKGEQTVGSCAQLDPPWWGCLRILARFLKQR